MVELVETDYSSCRSSFYHKIIRKDYWSFQRTNAQKKKKWTKKIQKTTGSATVTATLHKKKRGKSKNILNGANKILY
jgi:hypothetical protein